MLENNQQLLLDVLSNQRLDTLFQPIVNVNSGAIYGYQATSHGPQASCLFDSDGLRYHAARQHLLSELELLGIELAMERFSQLKLTGKLFVSLSPDALESLPCLSERLCRMIEADGFPLSALVVVLSEWRPFSNWQQLTPALKQLRQAGLKVALQELGIRQRPEGLMLQWEPDFIKLPSPCFSQLDLFAEKQRYLKKLLHLAKQLNCEIILDGVQTREESEYSTRLGFTLAQGNQYATPHPSPHAQTHIRLAPRTTTQVAADSAGSLLIPCIPLSPATPALEVLDWFQQNPTVSSLPIVDPDTDAPLGIVHQKQLLATFAHRFSHERFGSQPIIRYKSEAPLVVERSLTLTELGKRLGQRDDFSLEQRFIIVEQGRYQGIGEVGDIMRWLTETRIRQAGSANPLTGLPGNQLLDDALQQALNGPLPFAVTYFDLNHFKPFNDHYGYAMGDAMICLVAEVLQRGLSGVEHFLGHIGGDDFVLVLYSSSAKTRVDRLLDDFERAKQRFFSPQELQAGCYMGVDRQGKAGPIPLTGLAAGMLTVEPSRGLGLAQLAELASLTKHLAKEEPESQPVVLSWKQALSLLTAEVDNGKEG